MKVKQFLSFAVLASFLLFASLYQQSRNEVNLLQDRLSKTTTELKLVRDEIANKRTNQEEQHPRVDDQQAIIDELRNQLNDSDATKVKLEELEATIADLKAKQAEATAKETELASKLEQCTKSLSDERYVYRQIVPRRSMENTVKMINSIVPFIRTARNLASKITQNKDLNATESIKSLANQLINYHVPIGNDGKHIKEFFDTESDLGAYMSLVCPRPKKCATITENCMTSDKYQFSEETVDYLEQLDRQEFYHGGRSTSFSYKMLYDNKLRDYFKGEPTRIANQDKYETCALVANSGLVLSKEYGQQIDSHDAVIRCNLGPTKGYEKNVGSKTTFRVIVSTDWMWLVNGEPLPNGMIESQVQTKEEYLNGTETWVLRSASGEKNQPVDGFKHAHNLMGKLKTVALSVDFLERDSLDCSGNVFPTFHAEQTTTGMVGFYFALNHCKKISLYGFQDVTEETAEFGQFTYYDHSLKATWKTYALGVRENMDDEHMVLKVLANAFPDQITMVDQPHL